MIQALCSQRLAEDPDRLEAGAMDHQFLLLRMLGHLLGAGGPIAGEPAGGRPADLPPQLAVSPVGRTCHALRTRGPPCTRSPERVRDAAPI
jgi:hypothetical protein